jgi:hypothetical protein
VPATAARPGLVVAHGSFPGMFIIGDAGSLFHKPTVVTLEKPQEMNDRIRARDLAAGYIAKGDPNRLRPETQEIVKGKSLRSSVFCFPCELCVLA